MCYGMNCLYESRYNGECNFHGRGPLPCEETEEEFAFCDTDPEDDVSIHSRPIRRLTPQPTDRGRADYPSQKEGVTKKDFIGFAVLSTALFSLKGEVSNHKGIFDEK